MVWWKRLTKILRRGKRDKRKEGLGGGGRMKEKGVKKMKGNLVRQRKVRRD